jgi:nitrile hydratase
MTFEPGDRVLVSERDHPGHHRTPGYLKGRGGTVERSHGPFANPETLAYGESGLPKRQVYLISFDLPGGDRVLADIFEHWLEHAA